MNDVGIARRVKGRESGVGGGWVHTSRLTEAGFLLLNRLWRMRRGGRPRTGRPRRIGILTTGYIGDVVVASGMIRRVKERYPEARLHCFCYPSARPIVEENPRVDKVWAPAWLAMRRLSCACGLRVMGSMVRFARQVRRAKIDLLLVPCRQYTLLGTVKVALVAWLIQARTSVGLAYGNRGFFLDVGVPDQGALLKHESAWCADILQAAAIPGDCAEPDVEVSDRHEETVDRLLAARGIGPDHRLVLIHPGGGRAGLKPMWALKRWPAARFAEVARALARMEDVRVAVVGVEDERPLFEEMLARGATAVTDLVGQTSLQEFYVLAGRAAVVIGNDAGTTHVAAASGAPTIAIFGHTDFIGYRPLGPRVTVLRHPVACAPCLYWFDRSACEKAHICLHGVRPEEVVAEAKRWLSNGRRRARAPAGVREASP